MSTRLFCIALFSCACFAFVQAQVSSPQAAPLRERLNFNADWLFHRDDPDDVKPDQIDYPQLKDYLLANANDLTKGAPVSRPAGNPGGDVSFVQPSFDDKDWRKLNLPHDYASEGSFDINLPSSEGKLPWYGTAWYRKHFTLPASDAGPTADNRVKYEIVSGPGEIFTTSNGDPTDMEAFPSPERNTYNGRALAIVRAQAGQTGDIHLRATCDGLGSAEIVIKAK